MRELWNYAVNKWFSFEPPKEHNTYMYVYTYTSSIFGHALLKIVQNLLLQRFNDTMITFIRPDHHNHCYYDPQVVHMYIRDLGIGLNKYVCTSISLSGVAKVSGPK